MNLRRRLSPKAVVPVCVFAASVAILGAMVAARPSAESTRPGPIAPLVRVVRPEPGPVRIPIHAQGTVEPGTESDLVTEVSGRIVWASPSLASGGFFREGDVLLRIDPRDYEITLEGAKAALARAESDLHHSRAELRREESMRQGGASSRARLDDATHAHAHAEAGMREAGVAVQRAELDLERSEVRAPFAGRVRDQHVDRGQYVSRGVPVARVYSITYAEVRLPISDADLAFLDVPLDVPLDLPRAGGIAEGGDEIAPDSTADASDETRGGPPVLLSAEFAGATHEWTGRIVRTEGALDSQTRMVNVVARIDDPYGRELRAGRPPLPVGLFVQASIEGRLFEAIYEVPRSALRRRDEVWVVGDDDRLEKRRVSVLRSIGDQTFIRAGITPGEAIITSALEIATDGMRVRTVEIPAAPSSTPETTAAPVPS